MVAAVAVVEVGTPAASVDWTFAAGMALRYHYSANSHAVHSMHFGYRYFFALAAKKAPLFSVLSRNSWPKMMHCNGMSIELAVLGGEGSGVSFDG